MKQHFWCDPALPFVEARRASHSRACYRPHTHPALSVGAVDGGSSVLKVAGRPDQPLQAGDVVVIPAHGVHSCNPHADAAWSYQMLYLDVGWVTRLQDESRDDGHGLRPSPAAHVRDPEAYRRFCELNALLFEPLPAQLKEEALIDYIGSLLLDPVAESGAMPDWVADLAGYLRCNCEKNWPIAALSERVALSRYHLIRVFRQNTGLTPHAYQIDCRINLARQMLRAGCDLSDLALQLGFSDQSHFQRAFLQRTSITPGDYQRQMRR